MSQQLSVSSVKFPLPLWRYLILFRSWRQFFSWLGIVVFVVGVVQLCARLAGMKMVPLELMTLAVAIGSLVSVIMTFNAELHVTPASCRAIRLLENTLHDLRYTLLPVGSGALVYQQDIPRLLRWDEGNVAMFKDGQRVTLTGSLTILLIVRREMLKRRDID